MVKILKLTLIFMLTLDQLSASTVTDPIKFYIIQNSAAPFQVINDINNSNGIITDIVSEIYKEKNSLEFEIVPYNRMLRLMGASTAAWINFEHRNEENRKQKIYSKFPIFTVRHKLLCNKDFQYSSINDLFNKRIVLIRGFSYPNLSKYIESRKVRILIVESYKAAIKALEIGRGSCFPDIGIRMNYYLNKYNKDKNQFAVYDFSKVITDMDIHLTFSSYFPKEELKFVNERLRYLHGNGFVQKVIQNYIQ